MRDTFTIDLRGGYKMRLSGCFIEDLIDVMKGGSIEILGQQAKDIPDRISDRICQHCGKQFKGEGRICDDCINKAFKNRKNRKV
jgi:hypothetical protein